MLKNNVFFMGFVILAAAVCALLPTSTADCFAKDRAASGKPADDYAQWASVGAAAAQQALKRMQLAGAAPAAGKMVVLTNAGYAEVGGASTLGALDGIAAPAGVSRGRGTLLEIQSAPWKPLWFAVYDPASGFCAYLEVDAAAFSNAAPFGCISLERIDATHLYRHAESWQAKFDARVFGGNEFRIIAIANAAAAGAPACALRVFEFHDHYCPGVTSGILMAEYVKSRFPAGKSGYFVHAVEPWCKEDALMVLLNVTPGKRGYAVSYPNASDKAAKAPEARGAATIVYRQDDATGRWEGRVLGFQWAETDCPKTGSGLIDKLCMDLWYLARLDRPGDFVQVIKTFQLPEGVTPRDWARPGVDPLEKLGFIR